MTSFLHVPWSWVLFPHFPGKEMSLRKTKPLVPRHATGDRSPEVSEPHPSASSVTPLPPGTLQEYVFSKQTFYFGISDVHKKCKHSRDFPYTIHPVFPNVTILYNCGTLVTTQEYSTINSTTDFTGISCVVPLVSFVCSRIQSRTAHCT